jgi:hypothetical protein
MANHTDNRNTASSSHNTDSNNHSTAPRHISKELAATRRTRPSRSTPAAVGISSLIRGMEEAVSITRWDMA